ncbi:MAG: HAMP domain-containing protein, partial [Candidatus Electrothrix sp. ATG2]|nr:HAMP domain-containing protein [Candidatus Electrothrix sp. ATG2]
MRKDEDTISKRQIKAGLGRTLFLTFLLLALVPLSIVSYISYNNATERLRNETTEALVSAMEYKKEFIRKYFADIEVDIELQAELSSNVSMMKKLNTAFEESGLPVHEFITTVDWEVINTENGGSLRAYWDACQYRDIYLVDMSGYTLYSGSEEHLGDNVLTEGHSAGKLGQVVQTTLETGKSALSDYGSHDSGDGVLSLFLARALEDDETGEKIGALIFEFSNTQLDRYMQAHFGLGESGETYLVGTDFLIRSNLRFLEGSAILQTRIETELLNLWREEHDKWHRLYDHASEKPLHSPGSTEEMIYDNYQNIPVLGMYSSLDFLRKWDVHWVLVAEINEEDAFASATALKKIVVLLFLATAVLVLLLSWFITVRLVSPLRLLTQWSEQVAAGDLSIPDITTPANEIGQLNSSFRKTVISLQQAAEENTRYNWLQAGQLELDNHLRGDPPLSTLSQKIMNYLASYLGAQVGTLYIQDKDLLRLQAS